jgi:hypothetical protein
MVKSVSLGASEGIRTLDPDLGKVVLNHSGFSVAGSIIEQRLNILLPFCYPIRWQPEPTHDGRACQNTKTKQDLAEQGTTG